VVGFYNDAVATIYSLIGNIYDWANGQISAVYDSITIAYNNATAYVDNALSNFGGDLYSLINDAWNKAVDAWNYAVTLYNSALGYVNGWINNLLADISAARAYALDHINAAIDAVKELYTAAINDAAAFLSGAILDVQGNLDRFSQDWSPVLTAFFANPAEAIFAYLEQYFYDWLDWFLAFLIAPNGSDIRPPDVHNSNR
jgi:hypothetical protein